MSDTATNLQNAQCHSKLELEAEELKQQIKNAESTNALLREEAAELKSMVRAIPLELCWC